MSFTTYIESWNSTNPVSVVLDMLNKGALSKNSRIVLSFASFNFDSTSYVPGIENMSMSDIVNLTTIVHKAGAKISLSIGGATYPFAGSDLYSKPGDLAYNINSMLNSCGFDGVDFDIEDSYTTAPADFAVQAASLINTLRSLNSNLYITLTTPAQAWGDGMYQQDLLNMTVGNINAWQPMEYDLWIAPSNTYYSQIQWDIDYYINTWKVIPSKIVLGLMPGQDDMEHELTLQDTLNLTSISQGLGLQGVMTWDINFDYEGIDGNAQYAYAMGIQSLLNKKNEVDKCCVIV
jgi:chitinase